MFVLILTCNRTVIDIEILNIELQNCLRFGSGWVKKCGPMYICDMDTVPRQAVNQLGARPCLRSRLNLVYYWLSPNGLGVYDPGTFLNFSMGRRCTLPSPLRDLGERRKFPAASCPGRKRFLVHLELERTHLMAKIWYFWHFCNT